MVMAAAGVLAAPMAGAETLADALIAAYRNSNLLDQNRAVLRAADEDVALAVSNLRPVIGFAGNAGWRRAEVDTLFGPAVSEGLNASLNLSAQMTVLDFGRNRLGLEIARESVLAARQTLIEVEQAVLLNAVAAFVDVRLAQEVVSLQQSNLRLITQELRAAEARFEVGETTRTDVAIAEARLAASQSALVEADGNLLIAREAYKAAVGAYPGQLEALPKVPAVPGSLEEAQSVARSTHPLIRQAQHLVTISGLQVDLASAGMKPTVGVGASLSVDQDANDTRFIGLSLDQTIYAGGRLSALLRQAIAGQDRSRALLQQTAVSVLQNVGISWANLSVSEASITASEQQVLAARTAFEGVREEADAGARTTLDVLDAEQELLDAANARLRAEAQRYVSIYRLLSTMGLLTVDHLQLGIPTYDPEAYFDAVKRAPAHSAQGKKLDRILEKIGD
jgi:outer membrane protein